MLKILEEFDPVKTVNNDVLVKTILRYSLFDVMPNLQAFLGI